VNFREAGEGRPVVLIHGFPTDSRLFAGQLDAARDGRIRARLIAVDLPGFGSSPLLDPEIVVMTVEDLAGDLAGFIVNQRLQEAVVGGVAIGGYIAIELAARHPELVGGLVLFGPRPAPDNPAMSANREETAKRAIFEGAETLAGELDARPLAPGHADEVRQQMHDMIAASDPRGIAALVRGIALRPDPAKDLPNIDVPALVIAGDKDPFSPLEDQRRVAQMLPQGQLVVLEGVGHMAPIEAPEKVSDALAWWLGNLG
jgi:pimeloyl-ACP methyl ester carboxylesterase